MNKMTFILMSAVSAYCTSIYANAFDDKKDQIEAACKLVGTTTCDVGYSTYVLAQITCPKKDNHGVILSMVGSSYNGSINFNDYIFYIDSNKLVPFHFTVPTPTVSTPYHVPTLSDEITQYCAR